MSFLELLRPNKRTLVDILLKLPHLGVGQRVTRTTWAPFGDSYYEITKVRAKQDGKSARIWGTKVFKGQAMSSGPVPGYAKPMWRWMLDQEQQDTYKGISKRLAAVDQLESPESASQGSPVDPEAAAEAESANSQGSPVDPAAAGSSAASQ